MFLGREGLQRAVKQERIIFEPELEPWQYQEGAVDLRLGRRFWQPQSEVAEDIDPMVRRAEDHYMLSELPDRAILTLEPNAFVLGETLECITIDETLIGFIQGRSSWGRWGVSVHCTAPTVHPRWSGQLRLELHNHGTAIVRLYPDRSSLCQMSFAEVRN